ncbi:MAG: hypothetical protein KGZ65_04215 [Sphingomonadales bacterium]|nr:hypothetical protein [Sphingomonadaceae bacterium]MBS3930418.1 hypothetical protein [Sphingomonadales bacterium]
MAKPLVKTSKNKLADQGVFTLFFGLSEAKTDDSAGDDGKPKHEIVLTALQEGRGNERDRRYYTREAVVGAEGVFKARRKLFVNHLEEGKPSSSEDLRNWCATLKETWIENLPSGKVARKVRLKIHEEWLWTRCLEAPEEIALSIEGSGAGKEAVVEGETYMVIEKIWSLNATKFVTYPGNAKMGADLVESATEESPEETPMDLKALTEALLKEHRPDLVAAIVASVEASYKAKLIEAEAKATKIAEAAPTPATFAAAVAAEVKGVKDSFNASLDEMRKKLDESDRKLDAAEVKTRLAEKKALIEAKLKESKLAPEAKTERFLARCYAVAERKEGDKVITVAEQVDAEIAEQLKLTTSEFGAVRTSVSGETKIAESEVLTVEEEQILFNNRVLGHVLTLEQFREQKKKDAAAKTA